MKNIKLRVLSIVISVMMVVSLFPVSVFADEGGTSPSDGTENTKTVSTEEELRDAIGTAQAGETVNVKIISGIALADGVTIPADATVVIDLNGFTVSRNTEATTSTAAITNNGNLTIKDSDSVGGGKITAYATNPDTADSPSYANNTITNCGILTVESGTIENTTSDDAHAAFPIDNNSGSRDAIVYINGGVIKGRGAIRQIANGTTNKNEVIITGGSVEGTAYAIWVQNPNSNDNSAKLTVSGGVLTKILIDPSANFEIAITGGTISDVAIWDADTTNTERNPSGFITGGTFGTDVSAFCANGYAVKDNGNGTYAVVADPAAGKVAVIGDTYYATLQDAFDAATSDETTIKLIADVVLESPITVEKDSIIILELNGEEITYNSTTMGKAMITNIGNLTINDFVGTGKINYNYTGAADPSYGSGNYTISNCGTLTVNGGTITIADLPQHAKYPINNDSYSGDAILVINGGHLYNYNTAAIRQFCRSDIYKNSVTITGGVIEGYSAIWVQNPSKTDTAHCSLTITGGEIKTTATAYVNGTSELKDVSSKIHCSTDGGAWSDNSAISITGGTFNENVKFAEEAPENITIGEGATFNGYVKLPAPAIVVPDRVVDSIVSDNTADKETVQEIVDEIQNNAAVNDESYNPVEENDDVEELVVSLNGMTVSTGETTVVTEIVYTVTPQDASGNKVSTPAQPITFKLPIPAGMSGKLVEVLHNEVSIGLYKILGEGVHRYVEIESESFSTFTVRTTGDTTYVALVGTQAYATFDEALNSAVSGDVIVLLSDVTTDMVFLRKGVTLDLAGYTLTADYVTVFTGAAIIDSSEMKGRLVATEELSIKGDNGGSMPLYIDGKGYAFVPMVMNSKLYTEDLAEGTLFKVKFRPSINDDSELNATYFGDNGASDHGISISIRLSWENNGSVVTQDFTFSDELIAKVYAGTDLAPTLNITSLPADITSVNVIAVVTSATGVELVSNVGSYNVQ